MKKLLCATLAATLLVSGCGGPAAPASSAAPAAPASEAAHASEAASKAAPAEQVELMISAAASLTDCLQELAAIYEGDNPGLKITFNFGASGSLQQQIEQGAPADIFFSAGKKQMAALQEKGLMEEGTVQDVLENRVVLIVPAGAEKLASFEDLAGEGIGQIGVGEPESVPVGQYTAEAFESLGLSEKLAGKLVYAKDVREVLSWVETGNVDAGIVYETDAGISGDKVQICCAAPEGSHKPVIYPIGLVKDGRAKAEAQGFLDFLARSDLASTIFAKYGFTPVREEPAGI